MKSKNKFIIWLIIGFVLLATVSQYLLNSWTDTFSVVGSGFIYEGKIDSKFINTGYVYVWSGDVKILIPPSMSLCGKSSSSFIRSGDIFYKNDGKDEFKIVRDNDTLYFTIDKLHFDY